MSDPRLSINRIDIFRVPGVSRNHGFTIDDLSSGINIIHGPNGSGKSTTARCLQGLLWPTSTGMEHPSFSGGFALDGTAWSIELDAGHARARREGELADPPQIGPAENRHRYRLALDELLQKEADPRNFAKIIAEESRGGYDLDGAASSLGFREKPKKPSRERKALDEAKHALRDAQRQQEQVDRDARQLDSIKEEHEQTRKAERRIAEIEKAIEYHDAESRRKDIQSRLKKFPTAMEKLHRDDRDRLDDLDNQSEESGKQRTDEENRIRRAKETIDETGLSPDGVEQTALEELRTNLSDLSTCQADIRNEEKNLGAAQSTAQTAADDIGERVTELRGDSLRRVPIARLDGFLQAVETIRGRSAVIDGKRAWLDTDPPQTIRTANSQKLRDGIAALTRWIATPPQGPRRVRQLYWLFLIASTLSIGFCVLLGILNDSLYWWLGAAALFLLSTAFAWKHRNALYEAPEAKDRRAHRKTFQDTGLEPPEEWQTGAVLTRIRELAELLGDRELEDEREKYRKQLLNEEQALESDKQKLEQRRAEVERELGVDLDIEDHWFPQLMARIDRWLAAREHVEQVRARLDVLRDRSAKHLRAINETLRRYGNSETESPAEADASVKNLEERDRSYRKAVEDRRDAQHRLTTDIGPRLERIGGDRQAILKRLGLEDAEEHKIDEWLKSLDEFEKLNTELREATAVSEDKRESLSGHEDLLESERIALQQQLTDARNLADRKDDLYKQIVETEQAIRSAKEGHGLEDALAGVQQARSELQRAREENRNALVGQSLAHWVRREAIESTRPQVFVRASEILQKFTNHTLQLEFDDTAGSSQFRARRTDGTVSPLEELSVGERLQLLIAVRMAFVEQDEQAKLPLLLDETLGTSDDTRAGVIIDTVIDLARDGRQVFYFTAQYDEVAKWKEKLENADIESRQIDLATIRGESVAKGTPLVIREVNRPAPPPPIGQDYRQYGETLNVPGLDPMHTTTDEVHLWHLFRDTDTLHGVLKKGIVSWGQLRMAQETGGGTIVDIDQYHGAAASAKAIDAASEAWKLGRGKPVDRAVLQESGAVSDKFIDEVAELAEKLGGRAEKLVVALENGDVNRWRQDKTDELRSYCLEHGCISPEEPLSQEDIRIHAIAAVSRELEDGLIDEDLIDRFVGALPE